MMNAHFETLLFVGKIDSRLSAVVKNNFGSYMSLEVILKWGLGKKMLEYREQQFRLFLNNLCGSEKSHFRSFCVFGILVHLDVYRGFIGNDVHNFSKQFLS